MIDHSQVPIMLRRSKEYYHDLVHKLNGLLLPGGGNDLINSPYSIAASHLLDASFDLNKNGTHFPVFAACLSFEMLMTYHIGNNSWMGKCNVENVSLPMNVLEKNAKIWNQTFGKEISNVSFI